MSSKDRAEVDDIDVDVEDGDEHQDVEFAPVPIGGKPKAKVEEKAVAEVTKSLDEANLDDLFSLDVKKKKKKKKTDDGEGEEKGDKKKKKKKADGEKDAPAEEEECNYTYGELLNRVYELLRSKNPDLAPGKRYKLTPPSVFRVGTTRTCWANFAEICTILKRSPEHVMQFFLAELGTDGSIDGSQRLVIKGRYVPRKIESLLRKYIGEYVTCHSCRNPDTALTRDPVSRLYFVHCASCGSSRSVAAIKAGFHAVARGERKKARQ